MAQFSSNSVMFNIEPPLESDRKISIKLSPNMLMNFGFNIATQIMTASRYRKGKEQEPLKSITIMAHFDTGASRTSIDVKLAEYLGLTPTGESKQCTAGGPKTYPTYVIDFVFPNTGLAPFINLPVSSCELPFDFSVHEKEPLNPKNLSVLIGRDVMSRWNIVWNGPTSSVFISD